MTERLADITARIEGIRQLGGVVNAMRGIAAARAQQARTLLAAVDGYALIIAAAIGSAVSLLPSDRQGGAAGSTRCGLILFCAEQGFAGAFSERILDAAGADLISSDLFLVGTRGATAAAQRNIVPRWKSAMPSQSLGIPKLADGIAEALYARIATGEIGALDAIFSYWQPGEGTHIERRRLFPLDRTAFARPPNRDAPLLELTPENSSERTHRRLHACTALPRRAARLRRRERSAHGGHGLGAPPNRAPVLVIAGDTAHGTPGGNHGRSHRAGGGRNRKPFNPSLTANGAAQPR